ncbi:hypothetical protein ACFFGH_01015 [Lysobacter korlensis]|uniref:Ferric oxidoreductase domain-containing protein n=1 Tax=Lysobacter korlensis TaxID=553636 RepID=A0ABV6RHG2_9GAMM
MAGYTVFVTLHVSAGVLALITFWINAAMRKGSATHRLVGRVYLLAMTAVVLSGVPLVAQRLIDGHPIAAAFLGYLLVLTVTATWQLWRAVRDRGSVQRYTGLVYRALAFANMASGAAVLLLGLHAGQPLLIGFSAVGLFTGANMLRKRARLSQHAMWWREEHYSAVLAAGVATHIAFLSLGLPRLLPAVNGTALHYASWFGPLVAALAAKWWLDRHYRRRRPVGPGVAPQAAGPG